MSNEELKNRLEVLKEELKSVKGTECLVYSRVVGYFSPTSEWNKGKLSEFEDRVTFKV